MKRIPIYIIIWGAICASSCSDEFLNLTSPTSITSTTFYKTKAHFEQAVVGCYAGLRNETNLIFLDEMRSDNCHYTMYSANRAPYWNNEVVTIFLDDETTSTPSSVYSALYQNIAKCNIVLDRIDDSEVTEAEKKPIVAQAKFLRAYYYYYFVTHWGPVPLMLNEVTTPEGAFVGNSTVEEIYAQILLDVTDAINSGGLPKADRTGRVSEGAAKMLRAYANMSKPSRDYPSAERDLKDITTMGYELEANYEDVYSLGNRNGKEIIFASQYRVGPGSQQSSLAWRLIPRCNNTLNLMGFSVSNNDGGWCVPTKEMIESYESGDKRLPVSIGVVQGVGAEMVIPDRNEPVLDVLNFIPMTVPAIPNDPTLPVHYHFFCRKFFHPPYAYSNHSDDNFPLYRYADALLLLAENLVEQGKADEAAGYLNQVRARAGLDPVAATKQSVSDERRHELAFENKRWTDLIRTGQAISVMNEFGKTMKALDGRILDIAFNVTTERLVYPFPAGQLRLNKKLIQNPGYATPEY